MGVAHVGIGDNMRTFKGAIFDVDGTMLDSMHVWKNMENEFLLSLGLTPKPSFGDDIVVLSKSEILDYTQAEFGVRISSEEISKGVNKLLEEFYFHKAQLKEGVIPVLDMLYDSGVKMCVATATDRYLIEPALVRCGILGYFGKIFTCKEERTSKNKPDIFIRAAAYLGTEIKETLVFEDAVYAIKTAKKAGFPVAAVYDAAAAEHQDEIKQLCDYYYESLTTFKPSTTPPVYGIDRA